MLNLSITRFGLGMLNAAIRDATVECSFQVGFRIFIRI